MAQADYLQTQVPASSSNDDPDNSAAPGPQASLPVRSPPCNLRPPSIRSRPPLPAQQDSADSVDKLTHRSKHNSQSPPSSSSSLECQPISTQHGDPLPILAVGTHKMRNSQRRPVPVQERISNLRAQRDVCCTTESLQWTRSLPKSQRLLLESDEAWRPLLTGTSNSSSSVPKRLLAELISEADAAGNEKPIVAGKVTPAPPCQISQQIEQTTDRNPRSRSSSQSSVSSTIRPTQWSLSPPERHQRQVKPSNLEPAVIEHDLIVSASAPQDAVSSPHPRLEQGVGAETSAEGGQHHEDRQDGMDEDEPSQKDEMADEIVDREHCGLQGSVSRQPPSSVPDSGSHNTASSGNSADSLLTTKPHVQVKQTPYLPNAKTRLLSPTRRHKVTDSSVVLNTYPGSSPDTQLSPQSSQINLSRSNVEPIVPSPARKHAKYTYVDSVYSRLDEDRKAGRRIHRRDVSKKRIDDTIGEEDEPQPLAGSSMKRGELNRAVRKSLHTSSSTSSSGGSVASAANSRNNNRGQESSQQDNTLLQQVHRKFTTTYPQYTGSAVCFRKSLELLYSLKDQPREPHPSLWDDFVFRHAQEYLQTYIQDCQAQSKQPVLFAEYYYSHVRRPEYKEGVLAAEELLFHNFLLPESKNPGRVSAKSSSPVDTRHNEMSVTKEGSSRINTHSQFNHGERQRPSTPKESPSSVDRSGTEENSKEAKMQERTVLSVSTISTLAGNATRRSLPRQTSVVAQGSSSRLPSLGTPAQSDEARRRPFHSIQNSSSEPNKSENSLRRGSSTGLAREETRADISTTLSNDECAAIQTGTQTARFTLDRREAELNKQTPFSVFRENYLKLQREQGGLSSAANCTPINIYKW